MRENYSWGKMQLRSTCCHWFNGEKMENQECWNLGLLLVITVLN
jgi:Tat protein secretion system quality control protein TatD with DNase activity